MAGALSPWAASSLSMWIIWGNLPAVGKSRPPNVGSFGMPAGRRLNSTRLRPMLNHGDDHAIKRTPERSPLVGVIGRPFQNGGKPSASLDEHFASIVSARQYSLHQASGLPRSGMGQSVVFSP